MRPVLTQYYWICDKAAAFWFPEVKLRHRYVMQRRDTILENAQTGTTRRRPHLSLASVGTSSRV
jgi:hypothetical protein